MGKATGFLEFDRREDSWVDEKTRITGFEEFHNHLNEEERRCQASRCMDCGVAGERFMIRNSGATGMSLT